MSRIVNTRQPPAPAPAKKPKLTRQRLKTMDANAVYLAVHDIYLQANPDCVLCGKPANQIHHICRGVNRARSLLNTDTWLACCGPECHEKLEGLPVLSQVDIKQARIKDTVRRLRS